MKVFSVVLACWFCAVSVCLGSGKDSALQKHFKKVFRDATRVTLLESGKKPSSSSRLVEIHNGETLLGYGAEVQVVSRSGPFYMMVSVSPSEKVLDVQIPKYPHKKGRGVRKKSFLNQFAGVPYGNPLVLGEQVDAVSGATSSSGAVTDGVRKALLLIHQHYKTETAMENNADA